VPESYSSTHKRHFEGMNVSDAKSKGPSGIKEEELVQVRIDLEDEETTPSFQILFYIFYIRNNLYRWTPLKIINGYLFSLTLSHVIKKLCVRWIVSSPSILSVHLMDGGLI
jgi:hypothetical protein